MDTHGMKFVVDTTGVAKGLRDYRSAVDGIFTSLDKFEKHVNQTMQGVAKASANPQAINSFKKAVQAFSNVDIDTSAAKKLSALSAAMNGFKAPSETQAQNTKKFFNTLGNMPDLTTAFRSVKALSNLKTAMEGFKAPPTTQAANLAAFGKAAMAAVPGLQALSKIAGISGVANELASISIAMRNLKPPTASQVTNLGNMALALKQFNLSNLHNAGGLMTSLGAISNFRAPSAAQIRNLESFVNAIDRMKPPTNAAAISASMMQIANAASYANQRLGGLRTAMPALSGSLRSVGSEAKGASVHMMGLQNAFSGTFQVGSVLRSLLGSLTLGELGREFFQATQAANQFHASMTVLGASPLMADAAWARVRQDANGFGADLKTYSEGFAKFAAAANESGMKIADSFKVYEGFQTVMSVMHLGTEQQQSVGLAIREIMDKGYLSTQQVTRQLGLVLPGALHTLQEAWKASGHSGISFFDAMKKKMVDGKWALDQLAAHYKEVYGPALAKALESPIQQFNILKNNVMDAMVAIGDAGAKRGFSNLISQISSYISPDQSKGFSDAIGKSLANGLNRASDALRTFHDHWDQLKGPLGTALSLMGKWMILTTALSLGRGILSPLASLRNGLLMFNSAMLGTASTASGLSRVWGTLSAGTKPLSSSFNNLNANGWRANGMFNALSSTSRLAGVQFRLFQTAAVAPTAALNLLQGGMNGVKAAASGLLNLLGGAAGASLLAFSATVAVVTNEIVALGMHHAEAQRVIGAGADIFTENANLLGKSATNALMARAGLAGFDAQVAAATTPVKSFAGVVGSLADQLYRAADAAQKANIAKVQSQVTDLQTTINTRSKDTIAGAEADLNGRNHHSLKDFFGSMIHNGGVRINSVWDSGEDDARAKSDVAKAQRELAPMQTMLAKLKGETREQFAKRTHIVDLYTETTTKDPIYHGSDGSKKAKKPKADKAFNELKEFETALDGFLSKIEDSDPVGKLVSGWRKDVDDGAKTLLSKAGYMDVIKTAGDKTTDLHQRSEALIKAIQSGKLSAVAKKGLAARGLSPEKVIEDVRKWQGEQDDKYIEALNKDFDTKYKDINNVFKRLGKFDPLEKAKAEFRDDFRENMKDSLDANGAQAMQPVLQGLLSGTISVTEATAKFNEQLTLGHTKEGLRQNDIQTLIGLNNREAAAQDVVNLKAQREIDITENFLRLKRDEINMSSLSNDHAKVAVDLQKIVNDNIARKQLMTQKDIDLARTRLEQMQQENQLMERQKDILENNGLRTYAKDSMSTSDIVSKLDHDTFQGLEDTLVELGTKGKLSFKGMLDSIQGDIIRWASKGITNQIMNLMVPGASQSLQNGGSPTFWGKGFLGQAVGVRKGQNPFDAASNPSGDVLAGVNKVGADYNVNPLGDLTTSFSQSMQQSFPQVGQALGQALLDGVNSARTAMTGSGGLGASGYDAGDAFSTSTAGARSNAGYMSRAANDNAVTASVVNSPAIKGAAQGTASAFSTTMQSMIPLIGMSFASSFKSPIAQIGAMFASMMISKMLMGGGGGGGGGIGGLIGKLFGGGGGGGGLNLAGLASDTSSAIDAIPIAAFREGGYSNSPVSRAYVHPSKFINAPHYAEGTSNTSGMPAILHPNEAVIPLSRGRKIPIEGGMGQQIINNNFNVQSPDADSFRKSRGQIATELHMQAGRAYSRNHR